MINFWERDLSFVCLRSSEHLGWNSRAELTQIFQNCGPFVVLVVGSIILMRQLVY